MRYVIKEESDKTSKLKSDDTYQQLKKICTTKDKTIIKDDIYRDPYDTSDGKRSRVEDKLAISYKNKCAYCERICKADIEHYRPKNKVTGVTHDGYYWLCYEWTNLIPSCITCNREGAKHNHFPIIGKRVSKPAFLTSGELDLEKFKANSSPLIEEIPYLLHPEVDHPDTYFEFEIDDKNKGIRIKGIDNDSRGERTIKICKLNRLEIRLDRKLRVIDDFIEGVRFIYARYSHDENTEFLLDSLEAAIKLLKVKSNNDEKDHTLLRKYMVRNSNNFIKIVTPFLLERQKRLIVEIFESILI